MVKLSGKQTFKPLKSQITGAQKVCLCSNLQA
jgi:hypothetical protein